MSIACNRHGEDRLRNLGIEKDGHEPEGFQVAIHFVSSLGRAGKKMYIPGKDGDAV